MTLEEKIGQLQTNTPKSTGSPIPRIDWPAFPYHRCGSGSGTALGHQHPGGACYKEENGHAGRQG